jgi:serine/threonine-protein kinase
MQQATRWLAADRYEVGEVVGQGGYGMVCRGLDRKTGQEVALKMLSPEAGRDPDLVERMLREQQALVALTGTCAVTAIDLCRLESGAPCLVMEWLEGRDLEQQLAAWEGAGQLGNIAELLTILKPLARTLERAHEIGIVHRDIKPANIFLTPAAASPVRLLDFGLSRMRSAAPLTAMGMVMGSPSYIAPETWRGNSTVLDGRADLFALAVIVFRWLTGKLPFDAGDLIAKMTAVTSGPRPSAVALRPELPTSVDAWLSLALAVERDDRFQTGSDFYDALEAALRGETWARPHAEVSGVRSVPAATAAEPERKSALTSAWRAAASLLSRFTGKNREPTEPPPAAPATTPAFEPAPGAPADEASAERQSVWLDSEELEDVPPSSVIEAAFPAPAPAPPKPKKHKKPKPKSPKRAERAKKPKAAKKRKTQARKRKS